MAENQHSLVEAAKEFMKCLRRPDINLEGRADLFTKVEMENAIIKFEQDHPQQRRLLFSNTSFGEIWSTLTRPVKGCVNEISMTDLIKHLELKGIPFIKSLYGGTGTHPAGAGDFFTKLAVVSKHVSRNVHFKQADKFRTIGIYTDYVSSTDFDLEQGDIDFLFKQGIVSAVMYFEHRIKMLTCEEGRDTLQKLNLL